MKVVRDVIFVNYKEVLAFVANSFVTVFMVAYLIGILMAQRLWIIGMLWI